MRSGRQARVFRAVEESGVVGSAYQYDFSVSAGEFYQSETIDIGETFVNPQSPIEPNVALTADLVWIESQPGSIEPPRNIKNNTPPLRQIVLSIFCVSLCLTAVLLMLAVGVFWLIHRKNKAKVSF